MLRQSARQILQGASAMVALAAAGGSPSPSPAAAAETNSAAPLAPSLNSPPPPLNMLNTTNSTLSFIAAGDDEWREDGERIILSTDQGFIKTETYVDQDISDLHTVFLACALTVAPLLGICFSVLGIRYVWKKFQEDTVNDDCNDMLARAETSNTSTRQSLSAEQVKASDSQFSVLPIEEVDETSSNGPPSISGATLGVGTAPQSGTQPSVLPISQSTASSQSSNGSIITLMMKNNTLIVEKQEPAIVITRSIPTESLVTPSISLPSSAETPTEKAKIPSSNTGLSQSDTSLSSIDSSGHNPGYQYGNQVGYDTGPMGYPSYAGYVIPNAPDRRPPSAPSPWPSADYASLVASLPISSTPQASFDEDATSEEKRRNQRKRAHVRTGSCGPGVAEDEVEEETMKAAAARAHKRSSLPLLQPLTLLVSDERPLRSPVLEKLRLEDSLSAMERLPTTLSPPAIGTTPKPVGPMPKSPPPRSPLAAAPIPEEDPSHSLSD